eukprot:7979733-Pyramimonas_sp.AAC.2
MAEETALRMKQTLGTPLRPDRDTFHALMESYTRFARPWNDHGLKMLELFGSLHQEFVVPNAIT